MSDRWDSGWWFFGTLVAGVIALVLIVCVPTWIGTYYSQRSACHSFGVQTSREVKFQVLVRFVAPISWDCFTRTADGKWIPTKNLREFGEQP